MGEQREGWLDPKMKLQVQMRHAMTLREMGQFNAAMDIFESMLKEKATMLDIQVQAALTYQMWAEAPEKEELYRRAIAGGRKNEQTDKNTVMGWNRLSRLVYQYPKFRDTYHEARYNMAVCYYSYALRLKSSDDKKKYLGIARDSIEYIHKLHPEMGGEKWYAKYDTLLKRVQRELGEASVGLAGTAAAG
jgi:tetratricopeptide (TPR) repeat protein